MAKWIPPSSIQLVQTPQAEHGVPTVNFGNSCASYGSPFLQNCQYDGVGMALQYLYGNRLKPARELTTEEKSGLISFDQNTSESGANLISQGLAFIPPTCKTGSACRLHLAFHGCSQNTNSVGSVFAEKAGYLPWAVANNIVVVFPQAASSPQNPKGCWDWFAYTGSQFATKSGPQMRALRQIIQQISGF